MLDFPCNNDTEVRKIQEEVCQSSFSVRRVQIEFPDGSSDELGEVSSRLCIGSTSNNASASSVVRRSYLHLLNASKDKSLCGNSLCGTLGFTHLCDQSDHNSTRDCRRIRSGKDSRKRPLKVSTLFSYSTSSEIPKKSKFGYMQLGYVTNPSSTNFRRNCKIQVSSGIVPCIVRSKGRDPPWPLNGL